MTMGTSIYVQQPVNPERLFRFLQSALSARQQDDYHRPPNQPYVDLDGSTYETPEHATTGEWGNRIGQGLPAMLQVTYGVDGPIPVDHCDCEAEPEGCECAPGSPHVVDDLRQYGPFIIEVWMDTAYRYRADNGAGCGDLHAYMVASTAAWLADQPGSPGIVWTNGETGITSDSLDRLHELGDPVKGCPLPMVAPS